MRLCLVMRGWQCTELGAAVARVCGARAHLSPRAGAPIFSCACPSNVQKSVPALRWRVHHVEPPLATSMEEKRNWALTGLGLCPPLLVAPLTPVDCVTLSPRRTECGAAEGLRVSSITPFEFAGQPHAAPARMLSVHTVTL